jgi:beta-glucanase (GH16 family)
MEVKQNMLKGLTRNRLLLMTLVFVLVITAIIPVFGAKVKEEWTMVWNDEFDGAGVDTSKWNFVEKGDGFGNNELQRYTARPENACLSTVDGNSCLVITARKESYLGNQYTSAKVFTQNKGDWTYGKFEIRARLPQTKGIWPAMWMMPTDYNLYTGWPVGGEIDIMEMLGHDPDTVYGTIHYGNPWTHTGASYKLPDGSSFADGFHIFGLEWQPGEMRWYVDGVCYQTQQDWFGRATGNLADFTYPAPFDRDFYLQLNVAVGGNWPGNPDAATILPQTMAVDYVRAYKYNGEYPDPGPRPGPAGGATEPLRQPLADGNMIDNGDFGTNDLTGWEFLQGFGGTGDCSVVNGMAKITPFTGGSQNYAIQLVQKPLFIEALKTYRVTFDAKADAPRNINIKVSQFQGAWNNYSGDKNFAVGANVRTYSFDFTMNAGSDNNARLEFNLGLNTIPVYLDNVKVIKIDASQLKKTILADGNLIHNGTFDQGPGRMIFWELTKSNSAFTELSVGTEPADRQLRVTIKNKNIDIEVRQKGIRVEKHQTYTVSFDTRSLNTRGIIVNVGSTGTNYVSYAQQSFVIDTEMKKYTFDFTMNEPTDTNARFCFEVGGDESDVWVDNVRMTKKQKIFPLKVVGPFDNLITNGGFDVNDDYWGSWSDIDQDVYCNSYAENGKLVGEIGDYEGSQPWSVQVYQNELPIQKGATYRVGFDASSSVARDAQVLIEQNDGAYTRYFQQTIHLTPDLQTYTFDFKMTRNSDPKAHMVFCLGNVGSLVGTPHNVYLDNVGVVRQVALTDNLAVGCNATASSSMGTNIPNKAVDGNAGTRWESAFSDPQWICLDLGANFNISRVLLNWEPAYAKVYKLQVSTDGANWTDVYSTTTGDGKIDDISFATAPARFVRMYGTQRATGYGYSLWEFEVYQIAAPPSPQAVNLALGKYAAALSVEGSYIPNNAFDGNTNTRWGSVFSDPQWLEVDLGSNYSISRVILSWEAACAASYQLQVSRDNMNWTTVYSTNSCPGGFEELKFAVVNARYVRMYGLTRATLWGYSLFEFEVYEQ